jgi:hypothetical protein
MPLSPPRNRRKKILIIAFLALVAATGLVGQLILNSERNFSIVALGKNGDIQLLLFDLNEGRNVRVTIPGELEMKLAMRRGTLRAKNAVRLSEIENLGGVFLSDSIMKTLYLPVDYWAEREVRGVFLGGDVPVGVSITLLAFGLTGLREEEVDLADTAFLKSQALPDGEGGYVTSGEPPLSLVSLFSDPVISKEQIAARLVNRTGEREQALFEVTKILEVLGAKPAPTVAGDPLDVDCIVSAKNPQTASRVASVFNCRLDNESPKALDVELIFGTDFVHRF